MNRDRFLAAMRATAIPAAQRGRWRVIHERQHGWSRDYQGRNHAPGDYVALVRLAECGRISDNVMRDDDIELSRHLEFCFRASGRVLITGLGLGCVLRGVLVRDDVSHVTVIERDLDVLKLVAPYLCDDPRVEIIEADAREWVKTAAATDHHWDAVWHDIWTDRDAGEPHLAVEHGRLMIALRGHVDWQGAWNFPRYMRTLARRVAPSVKL